MNVQIMLYVSIYICLCLIMYDIIFSVYVRIRDRNMPKRIKRLRSLIDYQTNHYKPFDNIQNVLYRLMRNENYMLAFVNIANDTTLNETAEFRKFIVYSRPLFHKLALKYEKRSDDSRALFAYMISIINIDEDINSVFISDEVKAEGAKIAAVLIPNMLSKSIYVCYNTIKAVNTFKKVEYIERSLNMLNVRGEPLNDKLISDSLLEFSGDTDVLLVSLWKYYDGFNPYIQLALINYFRLLPLNVPQDAYYERLHGLMKSDKTDMEVKIAVIRYFRKHIYNEVYEDLLRILYDRQTAESINYAIAAASALQVYPSERTVKALTENLSDKNWYIRYNCADSLMDMNADIDSLISGDIDRYGKDMLIYRRNIKQLKNLNELAGY